MTKRILSSLSLAFGLTCFVPLVRVQAQPADMIGEWVLTGGSAAPQIYDVITQGGGGFLGNQ